MNISINLVPPVTFKHCCLHENGNTYMKAVNVLKDNNSMLFKSAQSIYLASITMPGVIYRLRSKYLMPG